MRERIDPTSYSPERLLGDLERTCHSILAPFDRDRTQRALEVFDPEMRSCVVQLKATDKPGSGVYYRFFYKGPEDLTRRALEQGLVEGDGPNVRLQQEVLGKLPGATRAGLDFDSNFGLAKVWTFTGGPTAVERLACLTCLPESLRAHQGFFAEHGLRQVFFLASDYQGGTMNVYFGWDDDCRNPEWIARMVEATGGAGPSAHQCAEILKSQAMSGGVGLTFAWDRPELLRWCLYSLEVRQPVELPERLEVFAQAPTLNQQPQYNVAWSYGGSRTYMKLEKSYSRDASYFLTQQMGGDLRPRELHNA